VPPLPATVGRASVPRERSRRRRSARRVVDLAAFLAHHAIEAKRFEHPPVMTVEESERLVPALPGAKTKNLFLRD
jgi:hypothetical protein